MASHTFEWSAKKLEKLWNSARSVSQMMVPKTINIAGNWRSVYCGRCFSNRAIFEKLVSSIF